MFTATFGGNWEAVMQNRQIILTGVPDGELKASHFEMRSAPMPEVGENDILVKTLYMSLDGAVRLMQTGLSTASRAGILSSTKLPPLGEGDGAVPFKILS